MFTTGDLVEVYPEFHEDDLPSLGIVIRQCTLKVPGMPGWVVVLRGDQLVHHPEDTLRLAKDKYQ